MRIKPYVFLGFDIRKIQFQKSQQEELTEVRISVNSCKFNSGIITLNIEIELDYDESKNNTILYSSGFKIEDKNLEHELSNSKSINQYIPVFLRTVLPFIRENLMSITKDAGNPILLPTIDCEDISLDKVLILTSKNSEN